MKDPKREIRTGLSVFLDPKTEVLAPVICYHEDSERYHVTLTATGYPCGRIEVTFYGSREQLQAMFKTTKRQWDKAPTI